MGILALGLGWGIGGMMFLMNLRVTIEEPPKTIAPQYIGGTTRMMYLTDPPTYSQDNMPNATPTPPTK